MLKERDRWTLSAMIDFEKKEPDGCFLCRAGDGSLSHMRRLERLGLVEQHGWEEAWGVDDPGYTPGVLYRCFRVTTTGHAALSTGEGVR